MSLQTLSEWLRCPNCFQDLSPAGDLALRCPAGHAFDVNKRGFITLAAGSRKLVSDSAAMLDARDGFLDAGWYRPLRDTLAAVAAHDSPSRVLDVGCGTGYYLDGVLTRASGARALGLDLSPIAVARTVRRSPSIDGLVADVWSPLPLRDETADVLLNVFAPRNAPEFSRVLRPDGLLAVVIPQERHLQELRAAGLMIDVQAGKAAQLIQSLGGYFELEGTQTVEISMHLSPEDLGALVGMGPSAHHTDAGVLARAQSAPHAQEQPVTAAFELLRFRKRAVRNESHADQHE